MKVLFVVNTYATESHPSAEPFVRAQVESLRREGIEVDVFNVGGNISKANYLKAVPQVRKRIKQGGYDLVHGHYVYSGWVAAFQPGIPTVVSFMGSDLLGSFRNNGSLTFQGWCNRILSRFLQNMAQGIIVKSRDMFNSLKIKNKAVIIPNGVDFSVFRPIPVPEARIRLGLKQDVRYVFFSQSHASEEKGYAIVKRAVELLQDKGVNVELLFAQDVPHEEMAYYYNASDIVTLASISEGSPNVIKEAMACNKPIVSTDVGDVREVISNTSGCMIVKRDHNEFANAIESGLQFGNETKGRIDVQGLELQEVAKKIIRFYSHLMKR